MKRGNKEKMKNFPVMFMEMAEDREGRFWFFDQKNQFLGYMREDFKRIYPVRRLKEDMDLYLNVRKIFFLDDKIFISSHSSVQVIVYSIREKKFFNYEKKVFDQSYYNTFCNQKHIYFFPFDISKPVYIFDIAKGVFKSEIWITEKDCEVISEQPLQKETTIYFPIKGTNIIWQFELENFSCRKIALREDIFLYSVLIVDAGIWIAQTNNEAILFYDGKSYLEYGNVLSTTFPPYISLVQVNNKLIALPYITNSMTCIDTNSGTVQYVVVDREEQKEKRAMFVGKRIRDDMLILFPWAESCFFFFDCKTYDLWKQTTEMSEDDYFFILVNRKLLVENEDGLRSLIKYIQTIEG